MPPATPSPDAASGTPESSLLMGGSAPQGTFWIPEDGAHVPEDKSFLSRFQQGLSMRMSREHQTPAKPLESDQTCAPTENDVDALHGDSTVKTSMARGRDALSYPHGSQQNSRPTTFQSQSMSEPRRNSSSSLAADDIEVAGKSVEEKADEAEDGLINIVSDEELLLHEGRPSYPILRFCASTGLLDQHFLDTLGLPLGFIWAPFGELSGVRRLDRSPNRCGTCGSFLAKGNGDEDLLQGSPTWSCNYCGRDDNMCEELETQGTISPQTFPELFVDTVEYSHPDSAIRQPPGRGAIILIVDENVEPEEAKWARAAGAAVYGVANATGSRFALIKVGAGCSVAVHSKDREATPVLEMMSTSRAASLSPEEKEMCFLTNTSHVSGEPSAESNTHEAHLLDIDPFIFSRALPDTYETRTNDKGHDGDVDDHSCKRKTRFPAELEARHLDAAITIAMELISGMADPENSRVLSLITGPPSSEELDGSSRVRSSHGLKKTGSGGDPDVNPALASLYEQLGQKAGDLRIALDFLCFGAPHGFAGPVLLAAARRSRGGIVYTAAHSFSAASALAESATFLAQRSNSPGVVSIRVSSPFAVVRVIGPASPTAAPHTYAVPGIDPTTGFTIILHSKPNPGGEKDVPSHAVLQLAAKSLDATRVVTARIPVTTAPSEYLNSLDAEICALVLGKACVVSGGALIQPMKAARSIDVSARRLLRGSEATVGVVRLLYELRRGVMIEKQVSSDCSLVLRSFFLRAESGIGSLLMSPRLFTDTMSEESTGLMAEVPLEKSYVTKTAVLVLDTGFNVFVYVGEDVSTAAEEAISESACSVAAQRFSPCQLWKLRPGPDAEYLLNSYLSPKDTQNDTAALTPVEQGFIQYCKSLAPDSITVRLLQSG